MQTRDVLEGGQTIDHRALLGGKPILEGGSKGEGS